MKLFRRIPDFLIIGAQKAGTTSMHKYLSMHPQIVMSKKKELHYFDSFLNDNNDSLRKYKNNFPLRLQIGQKKIAGETTPYYLFHPHVPKRVKKSIPDVKLIVLLRNPVERAFSLYNAHINSGVEKIQSFKEAIDIEDQRINNDKELLHENKFHVAKDYKFFSYLARGRYFEQIENWFKYFDENQFIFIESSSFFKNIDQSLKQVFSFLNVKNIELDLTNIKAVNKGSYTNALDNDIKNALLEYFREPNQKLYELIGQSYDW